MLRTTSGLTIDSLLMDVDCLAMSLR